VDDLMQKVREKLEKEGKVPPGYKWGQGDAGGNLQARFEEGSGAPIIDSSKSRFNGPVANPTRLKSGQPQEVIAKLKVKPSLTPREAELLTQMEQEVKRRLAAPAKKGTK
jgi:hypothetical protein